MPSKELRTPWPCLEDTLAEAASMKELLRDCGGGGPGRQTLILDWTPRITWS